jgi:hypothetical protein
MSASPSPVSSPIAKLIEAGSRLTAALESILPPAEDAESLLYTAAETDPPTAAFLQVEGLRPEPRVRIYPGHWAA